MSPTTYQKARRIKVQEDKKITLLMLSSQCSTRKRGYKKVYKFVLIIMSGKHFFFRLRNIILTFKTFHTVSLRSVMNVHRKFEAGFHVVGRSNRLWTGLSMDMS